MRLQVIGSSVPVSVTKSCSCGIGYLLLGDVVNPVAVCIRIIRIRNPVAVLIRNGCLDLSGNQLHRSRSQVIHSIRPFQGIAHRDLFIRSHRAVFINRSGCCRHGLPVQDSAQRADRRDGGRSRAVKKLAYRDRWRSDAQGNGRDFSRIDYIIRRCHVGCCICSAQRVAHRKGLAFTRICIVIYCCGCYLHICSISQTDQRSCCHCRSRGFVISLS